MTEFTAPDRYVPWCNGAKIIQIHTDLSICLYKENGEQIHKSKIVPRNYREAVEIAEQLKRNVFLVSGLDIKIVDAAASANS